MAVSLRRLDKTVNTSARVSAAGTPGEEPILAADHERSNRVFYRIRIRRQQRVADIANRAREYGLRVRDRFSKSALRRDREGRVHEPLTQFIEDGPCGCLSSKLERIDVYLPGLQRRSLSRLDAVKPCDDIDRTASRFLSCLPFPRPTQTCAC